jgi:hypothetical protein
MGGLMVFSVGIMCAVGINGINPSQIGLVLSYSTMLTQLFGMLTRQSAEVEVRVLFSFNLQFSPSLE